MTMDDKLMISSFFWHLGGFGQLVKDLRKILKIIESFNWSWFINNVSCNRIENKDLKKIGWVWWEPGSYLGTDDLSKPGGNDGDDDHGGGNYNKKVFFTPTQECNSDLKEIGNSEENAQLLLWSQLHGDHGDYRGGHGDYHGDHHGDDHGGQGDYHGEHENGHG